jgi:putative endopeptidase
MDDPTRAEALKKLGNFDPRVGYPNKWRDYSAMQSTRQAVRECDGGRKFEWNRQVARLGSRSTAKSGA